MSMKEFIIKQSIRARPMTFGEYVKIRNWKAPDDTDPEAEGYFFYYSDKLVKGERDSHWMSKKQFESKTQTDSELSIETISNKLNHLVQEYPEVISNLMSSCQVLSASVCIESDIMGRPLGRTQAVVNPIGIFNALLGDIVLHPVYEEDKIVAFIPTPKSTLIDDQ